jgi:hypothetical protein
MTTSTIQRNHLRAFRQKLDDLRLRADGHGSPFFEAMEKVLTAASYQDDTLMRAALEEANTALVASVEQAVDDLAAYSSAFRQLIQEFTRDLEGRVVEPDEQFDELGHVISRIVAGASDAMRDLRDGAVATVSKHGVEVPNAEKLDEHIAYWETVKADLVDGWPWSTGPIPLPPTDREMVARSRAAWQAGERGESLEAVIARRRSK